MIELKDVKKSFGSNHVLRGVNLMVERGTSMVIIGGSGTGKSIAIKSVLGLVTPDAGEITVDGQDVTKTDRDAFLARFGMLFQGGALFDSIPVWQNVAFRLLRGSLKRPKAEAREIAIEKLRRVGLTPDVADRLPAELSGGMRKRAGFARAIALDPAIVFLDEPTAGLDPNQVLEVRKTIKGLGKTILLSTHILQEVRKVADRILLIHQGRLVFSGTPEDLREEPSLDDWFNRETKAA